MRGSEKLLYMGNFHCLCAGVNENESLWQMKRIIVSDTYIYYFPYTNYTIKTPKVNEDWSNYKDLPSTIPQIQERMQYIKQNKLDPDSVTAPPLQVQQVSDKQVFMISIEQLVNYLSKDGYNTSISSIQGQAICLINKLSKQVQYLIAQNQADNLKFFRSIIVGNAFQKYYTDRNSKKIQLNQNVITWLQDSVTEVIAKLDCNNENLISTYQILCECNNLVNGLIFRLNLKEHLKSLQLLLESIKPDQIINLTLKNCNLKSIMIQEIAPILKKRPYLQQLDFSQNSVDDRGIDQIAMLFEKCLDINYINLSANIIQGKEQYLEIFLLKAGAILNKVSIDLSQNQLNDSSILIIENRIIKDDNCQIININLSYNRYSKDGQMSLFNLFSKKAKPNLIYKIYPLPYTQNIVEQLFNIKKNNQQEIIFEESQELQGSQARRGQSILKQPQHIFQHHPTLYQKQTIQFNFPPQLPQRHQITFHKKQTKKQLPSNTKVLQEIRNKEEQILQVLHSNNNDPPVEEIYQITEEIKTFQYNISHTIVNQLLQMIWSKLNDAILFRDNYSISFLTFSSFNLGMDITIFKEKYVKLSRKLQLIENRINKLLNFQIEESKINKELDDLISLCHRLDIRGTPIDFLLQLKLERETIIRKLVYQDYVWQFEYYDDLLNDSKQFIFRDIEYASKQLQQSLPVTSSLLSHPFNICYYDLTKISIQEYEQYLETLTKIIIYQNSFQDKTLINTHNILDFDKVENEKILYFAKLGQRRAKFIVYNHYENFNQNIWNENSEEHQLNFVRVVVNYYSAQYRKQQLRYYLEKVSHNYTEMKLNEIIEDIDVKQLNCEYRYQISDLKIKHLRIILPIYTNQDINQPKHIFEYPYLNRIQQLDIEDPIYVYAQSELIKQLKHIVSQIVIMDSENYDNNSVLNASRLVIDICTNSPCPCLLGDDLYIFLIMTQLKIKETNFQKLFLLFLHYLSPSKTLMQPLYDWLITTYQDIKLLQLITAWINNIPMIYWLPSIQEINFRLNKSKIMIHYLHSRILQIEFDGFATVSEVMNQIYEEVNESDKGSLWIYVRVEFKQEQQGQSNIIKYLDIPLLSQLGFWEHFSRINQQYNVLSIELRRRIFCMDCVEIQSIQEITNQFINYPYICQHYNNESINKIIIILMCIESINDEQQNTQDINIYNYIQFIPVHLRGQIDIDDLINQHQEMIAQFAYFDQTQLTKLIKIILSFNPCFNSSIYQVNFEKENCEMIVNYHGIYIYQGISYIQSILYSEIVGISISSNQLRLHSFRQKFNKFIVTFQDDQSLECYQNILSYLVLLSNEKPEYFSQYYEYSKIRYKYNLHLTNSFDQNEIVEQLLSLAQNTGIQNILDRYQQNYIQKFLEDSHLQRVARKQLKLLQNIQCATPFRPIDQIFPFQKDCPIIQFLKPKFPQSQDINIYFGKGSRNEIKRLFDPIRELFPSVEYLDDSPHSSRGKSAKESLKFENQLLGSNHLKSQRSKGISSESRKVSLINSRKTLEQIQIKSEEKQEVKSEQQTYRKISNDNMFKSQEIQSENNQKASFIYKIQEEEENIKSEYSPSILQQQNLRVSLSLSKTVEHVMFQSNESDINRLRLEGVLKSQQSAILLQNQQDSQTQSSQQLLDKDNESIFGSINTIKSKKEQKQHSQSQQFIN
ncbi:unnamed protein product [Paramecium pentaurelia]|uniref:Uncharacterized protein n=1 Tax=Paramecium pentaurelia TaxID=43138 RepID=A0A8S1XJT7_9CILI|nr:unnamed protein product [Paramecium pentaurelia]